MSWMSAPAAEYPVGSLSLSLYLAPSPVGCCRCSFKENASLHLDLSSVKLSDRYCLIVCHSTEACSSQCLRICWKYLDVFMLHSSSFLLGLPRLKCFRFPTWRSHLLRGSSNFCRGQASMPSSKASTSGNGLASLESNQPWQRYTTSKDSKSRDHEKFREVKGIARNGWNLWNTSEKLPNSPTQNRQNPKSCSFENALPPQQNVSQQSQVPPLAAALLQRNPSPSGLHQQKHHLRICLEHHGQRPLKMI